MDKKDISFKNIPDAGAWHGSFDGGSWQVFAVRWVLARKVVVLIINSVATMELNTDTVPRGFAW